MNNQIPVLRHWLNRILHQMNYGVEPSMLATLIEVLKYASESVLINPAVNPQREIGLGEQRLRAQLEELRLQFVARLQELLTGALRSSEEIIGFIKLEVIFNLTKQIASLKGTLDGNEVVIDKKNAANLLKNIWAMQLLFHYTDVIA